MHYNFMELLQIYIHTDIKIEMSFEPLHGKTNKMIRTSSEVRSGKSLGCPHEEAVGSCLYIRPTAKTLIRLGECTG